MGDPNDLRSPSGNGQLKQLVTGIMDDAEALVKAHLELAKVELKESMTKVKTASMAMVAATAAGFFGGFFLLLAIAMLIDTYTQLPSWAAYGIVAVGLLASAGILFYVGKAKLTAMETPVLPETKNELKEDARWVTKTLAHNS